MPNAGENSSTRTVDAVGRTIDIFEALHELEGVR